MKIFIGVADIASLLTELANGFEELGHNVTTYVAEKERFYGEYEYSIIRGTFFDNLINYKKWKFLTDKMKYNLKRLDEILSVPYIKYKNRYIIENHDVFIFIWRPWINESRLFRQLKKKGKKVVCIHLGSDVRHISSFMQEFTVDTSKWEGHHHRNSLNKKIQKIRYHELFADLIYSVPDQAGLLLRRYDHIYIPLSKKKNIIFKIPARKEPLIIHAPSQSGIKGTEIIESVIQKLKIDGVKFEFKLIKNMNNADLIKLLTDADILCDELYLHGPGVLGTEAMAAGCAVATRCLNTPQFQPPVCAVTPENLYEKLKHLIDDIDYRVSLSEKAKSFVEEKNKPSKIAAKILTDLENREKTYDYEPVFFIEKFRLPPGKKLSFLTKKLNYRVIEKLGLQEKAKNYKLSERGLL